MEKLKSSNTSVEERGCCFKVMIWFEKEIKKEAFLLFLIRCFYWLQEENTFVLYAFEKKFIVNILLICFYTKAFVVSLGIDVSHIGYCYLMIYIQLCHHLILCDFFGCFKNLILKRIIHLTSVMLHFDICLLLCTGNSVSWRMHVYRGGEEMERIHPKTKKRKSSADADEDPRSGSRLSRRWCTGLCPSWNDFLYYHSLISLFRPLATSEVSLFIIAL